jgi:hypothetical protein
MVHKSLKEGDPMSARPGFLEEVNSIKGTCFDKLIPRK